MNRESARAMETEQVAAGASAPLTAAPEHLKADMPRPSLVEKPGTSEANGPSRSRIPANDGRAGRTEVERIIIPSFRTRVRSFLGAMIGPRVDADTYRKRMVACSRCPALDEVQKRFNVKIYCKACHCPRWRAARLDRKNRRALWICPLGRHQFNGCAGCGGQRQKET
jgi:hypothetical protein